MYIGNLDETFSVVVRNVSTRFTLSALSDARVEAASHWLIIVQDYQPVAALSDVVPGDIAYKIGPVSDDLK